MEQEHRLEKFRVVQPFAIDEQSPLLISRREEARDEIAKNSTLSVSSWTSSMERLVSYAHLYGLDPKLPAFLFDEFVRFSKVQMADAYSTASTYHKKIIDSHCNRYINDYRNINNEFDINTGDNKPNIGVEQILSFDSKDYSDFVSWHKNDLENAEKIIQFKIPELMKDFKSSWSILSNTESTIPSLSNKLISQRIENLHFTVVDVFEALGRETAIAGSYSGEPNTIRLSSELLKSEGKLRRVFFHEMVHAISGQTNIYQFDSYNDDENDDESEYDYNELDDKYERSKIELDILAKIYGTQILGRVYESNMNPPLLPGHYCSRIGLRKGNKYEWLNEAVTEHITWMLLSQSEESAEKSLGFTSHDILHACKAGSYKKERALLSQLLGGRGGHNTSDKIGRPILRAFFENYRPDNKRPGRYQFALHKVFNEHFGFGALPAIDSSINNNGIVETIKYIERLNELRLYSILLRKPDQINVDLKDGLNNLSKPDGDDKDD